MNVLRDLGGLELIAMSLVNLIDLKPEKLLNEFGAEIGSPKAFGLTIFLDVSVVIYM